MPRFLCLPGFCQSGKVFAEKSSGLRKILTKKLGYELEYIDAPIRIEKKEQLPFRLGTTEAEAEAKWKELVERGVTRCWWDYDDGVYEYFAESYEYLVNYIRKNGPYDGIVGFSQGAAMAAIMVNSMKYHQGLEPFKVAVLFSGFAFTVTDKTGLELPASDESLEHFSARATINDQYKRFYHDLGNISTSVITVYGAEDAVVPPVRSEYLGSLYPKSALFKHDGGHYMPNKKQILDPIVDKIKAAVEIKPVL